MMSEQVVASAVVQHIIVKLLTNENVKPAEILMRCKAQFVDKMLSKTQVYMTGVSHLKKARKRQRLHLLQAELQPVVFRTQDILFINFMTEQ
jgi:hypothetical protein